MVSILKDKKHRWKRNSSVIVDLAAIKHNLEVIKARLKPGTQIMSVVKADAYGHGSMEIAGAIHGLADWFAVNDLEEGIALRNAGIELPILVFGVPDADTANLYSAYSLTATVSSLAHFDLLPAGTEYHLNFNTGMGRLGLGCNELKEVTDKRKSHPELICTGLYSHFATSDAPGSSKVEQQLERFKDIHSTLTGNLITHISNTGACFFYEGADFDMIRTGIGLYGYPPGGAAIPNLKPALEWRSYLAQVNPIEIGDTVSYGAIWEAPEKGFIGIIPVGYEDGLRRALSGNIAFRIAEKEYPQVGAITMNYCMVYLGRDNLPEGAEVVLISRSDHDLERWAGKLGTIPYEILTSISTYIPRTYLKE